MANADLNIYLRLKDQLSQGVQGIKGRLQNFATTWKQNWIAITAAITTAIIAIRKAFDYIELGAKAKQIEESFTRVAIAMEVNAKQLKQALKEASGETVNFSNIAGQTAALLGQGLSLDQITQLMQVTRVEARKMGQSVEEAYQQIAGAVTGGFLVTVKRNYGLQVQLAQAYENYAKKVNKSVDEVRKYYAAQAIANEIINKAAVDLKAFNTEQQTELEYLQSIKAWWTELSETIGKAMIAMIQRITVALNTVRKQFSDFMAWYNESAAKVASFLGQKELAKNLRDLAQGYREAGDEFLKTAGAILDMQKQAGELTDEQKKAIQDSVKAAQDANKNLQKDFNAMEEFGKQTARNLTQGFQDLFFNVFTGQFRSLKDVVRDFGNMMLSTIANILAQMLVIGMFKKIGLGGILGFQLGTKYVPHTGPYLLHRGEKVTREGEAQQSAQGNAGSQIIVIQAWDVESIKRNEKTLVSIIANAKNRNDRMLRSAFGG